MPGMDQGFSRPEQLINYAGLVINIKGHSGIDSAPKEGAINTAEDFGIPLERVENRVTGKKAIRKQKETIEI